MSLPALVSGAECGPSNPLQGLTKRFDQDRGLQQDHFGASSSGIHARPSLRTDTALAGPDQDARRFFSSGLVSPPNPFDVSSLRAALLQSQPLTPMFVSSPQSSSSASASAPWASDFMQQHPPELHYQTDDLNVTSVKPITPFIATSPPPSVVGSQWNPNFPAFQQLRAPTFAPVALAQHQPQQQNSAVNASQISWDDEFNLQELAAAPTGLEPVVEAKSETEAKPISHDGDELARTAGMLLENVKHETNPKFKNSQFMSLMQQLRDGLVVIEGTELVENHPETKLDEFKVDLKGKGRAVDLAPLGLNATYTTSPHVNNIGPSSSILHPVDAPIDLNEAETESLVAAYEAQKETEIDAYLRLDNEAYIQHWNTINSAPVTQMDQDRGVNLDWGRLQADWDQFEATTTGVRAVVNYQFQDGNPYLLGDSSRTRHHLMHETSSYNALLENVLELEAAVQRDMTDAKAWYDLGVKQQENEREQKALQALQRSVELDPTHLPSWLALAISYTNDTNRAESFNAIREWVNRNERYKDVVADFNKQNSIATDAPMAEQFNRLIQCLIFIARSDTSHIIDAEVQIALAVLLNTNEDYGKAQDCFRTALAVRPDDWLLYNRVGATMANSGHAEDALQYYYRALELNPAYIRARFNLGISCINLRRYEEAAQHILDALVLQDSDSIKDSAGLNDKHGVTSSALWDSLKTTCLHLQRVDLATLCDRQDLESFRINFHMR